MKRVFLFITVFFVVSLAFSLFLDSDSNDTGSVPCTSEFRQAVETMDVKLCEKSLPKASVDSVSYTGYENMCREWCIQEVAFKLKDAGVCAMISKRNTSKIEKNQIFNTGSYKDNCYMHLAVETNNITLCDYSETNFTRVSCKNMLTALN